MTDINTELEQIADEEFVDDTQLDEVAADAPKKGAAPAEKMDSVEGEEASKKVGKASPPKTKPSDASAKMEEVEEEDTDEVIAEAPQTEEEVAVEEESIDERVAAMDLSDDVSALTDTEGLEEEFKKKAATIFEAAIRMKLKEEV